MTGGKLINDHVVFMKARHHDSSLFSYSDHIILQKRSAWLKGTCACAKRISINASRALYFITAFDHNYGTESLDVCNSRLQQTLYTRTDPDIFSLQKISVNSRSIFFFAKIDSQKPDYYQLSICWCYVSWQLCFKLNSFSIKICEKSAVSKIYLSRNGKFFN